MKSLLRLGRLVRDYVTRCKRYSSHQTKALSLISDFLMLETGVTGAGAFESAREQCAIVRRQDSEAACDRSVVSALEADLAQAAKPEDLASLLAHYANGCLASKVPSLACAGMLEDVEK